MLLKKVSDFVGFSARIPRHKMLQKGVQLQKAWRPATFLRRSRMARRSVLGLCILIVMHYAAVAHPMPLLLGDAIESALSAVGITKDRLSEWLSFSPPMVPFRNGKLRLPRLLAWSIHHPAISFIGRIVATMFGCIWISSCQHPSHSK